MLIDNGGKMMKKGITPIIAVIILLLITVALAGFAWSFLSGYIGGLTGKNVQVADSYCASGTQAKIVLKNMGTEGVNVGNCPQDIVAPIVQPIAGTEATCGDITIVRTDTSGAMSGYLSTITTVPSQGTLVFTDTGCTGVGVAKICTYRIRAGASGMGPNVISVSCPG